MSKVFSELTPEHEAFIRRQHMFFVGSAPLDEGGHVNLSPKGYDTFRIFSPTSIGYLDLTGSGNETSAHLLENGRITVMFVAFEGAPVILRMYGQGRVVLPTADEWTTWIPYFNPLPGARQMIVVDLSSVKTSCGMSIPFMSYAGDRDALRNWATSMKGEKLDHYRATKNASSMDGLMTPLGQLK